MAPFRYAFVTALTVSVFAGCSLWTEDYYVIRDASLDGASDAAQGTDSMPADGEPDPGMDAALPDVMVEALAYTSRLSAGDQHSCTVRDSGRIYCWGSNALGQLGDGSGGMNSYSTTPVMVRGITNAVGVAAGSGHTCAVLATGLVQCWGSGRYGQLGNGESGRAVYEVMPITVPEVTTAWEISAGADSTCALLSSGQVQCWGRNAQGALGDGTTVDRPYPVHVGGIESAVHVASGYGKSCALLATGQIRCWGPTYGTPSVLVAGLSDVTSIGMGGGHTCAALARGEVRCWGENNLGQLGDGTVTARMTPVSVLGSAGIIEIAAGQGHNCGRRTGGEVLCWGENSQGMLGEGTGISHRTAVAAVGVVSAVTVATGSVHSCALLESGEVRCWGYNGNGQLGDGTATRGWFPVTVLLPGYASEGG